MSIPPLTRSRVAYAFFCTMFIIDMVYIYAVIDTVRNASDTTSITLTSLCLFLFVGQRIVTVHKCCQLPILERTKSNPTCPHIGSVLASFTFVATVPRVMLRSMFIVLITLYYLSDHVLKPETPAQVVTNVAEDDNSEDEEIVIPRTSTLLSSP